MAEPLRTDEIQGDVVHIYDGIEEADNRLPTWWLMTFFGAIAFAGLYWFTYELFDLAPGPHGSYLAAQLEAMDRGGPVTDEDLVALAADPAMVAAGRALFASTCVTCHGPDAGGKIGPNLTDDAWLRGGSPSAIYTTIAGGSDGKGMPAWKPSLGGGAVKQLTVYVMSLRGTGAPGKPPEGESYVAPPAAGAAVATPASPATPTPTQPSPPVAAQDG